MADYVVTNLKLSQKLFKDKATVYIGADNLFNVDYEDTYGVPGPADIYTADSSTGSAFSRLLKNSHQAFVLERPFVRRSAATPPQGLLLVRRSDYF